MNRVSMEMDGFQLPGDVRMGMGRFQSPGAAERNLAAAVAAAVAAAGREGG
eukprot:gene4865-10181_t